MRKESIKWRGIRLAVGMSLATLLALPHAIAQTAKVAASSVEITADAAKKELAVGFRLVDAVVTSVTAAAEGVAEPLLTRWEPWEGDKARACAWLVVVDTSNPARAKTIESGKEAVRTFLTGLPGADAVAVFGLARDLEQVAPFGGKPGDTLAAVATLKADGDASRTTLIYQNLREALPKLAARDEPRKAVLLITDGRDETPGGAAAQEIEKNKLIAAANEAGVVVHCLGYAETPDGQSYFGALKEIALQTEGLFFPATVADKKLPDGALDQLRKVMHGAGVAHVDVSKLERGAAITVTAKTTSGGEALVKISAEEVTNAITTPAEPVEPETEKSPEELAEEKKAADEAAAKLAEEEEEAGISAAKAEEEKRKTAAADKAAEDKKRLWIIIGAAVLLIIIIAALLMVSASRKRAAEEEARLAEAARLAEEDRIAEDKRRAAEVTKKAEVAPLAWLEMCDAQQTRQPVRISSLKIGRGQHNDIVLRNDSVSGNHCVLNRTRDGQWSVTDLNSGNGVILNGERVQQAELRHGDTIELGELKMRFLLHA